MTQSPKHSMDAEVATSIRSNLMLIGGYTDLLDQTRQLMYAQRLNDPDGWDVVEREHRQVEESVINLLVLLEQERREWERVFSDLYSQAFDASYPDSAEETN